MIFLIAPLVIAAGISALAGLLGGERNRSQSKRDIADQNAYNTPLNQVKRLQEAGLPMAAMTGAATGNQSALPEQSGEALGNVGSKISDYMTYQTTIKQLALLDAQTAKAREEAKTAAAQATEATAHAQWSTEIDKSHFLDQNRNNLFRSLDSARDLSEMNKALADNKYEMDNMELMYQKGIWEDGKKRQLFDAQLDSVLKGNIARQLQIDSSKREEEIKSEIYNKMKSGAFPSISAIIYSILSGMMHPSNLKY